jgi:hypothetical protein
MIIRLYDITQIEYSFYLIYNIKKDLNLLKLKIIRNQSTLSNKLNGSLKLWEI